MERELRIAVIGDVKTGGGPPLQAPLALAPAPASTSTRIGRLESSSPPPPPPPPPPPSSPTAIGRLGSSPPSPPPPPSSPTAISRFGSPPPPHRAAPANHGGTGPPHTNVAIPARRGSLFLSAVPPLPRRPTEDGVSISWGHKKKPNGGRRRPRPIACVYPKFQAPQPRGRPRPEPIPAMRRRGVEAIAVGSYFLTPKKALTGNQEIDESNGVLCEIYGGLFASVKKLENGCDQASLKTNIRDLRTTAFQLRRIILAAGYKPINEPLMFKGVCPR